MDGDWTSSMPLADRSYTMIVGDQALGSKVDKNCGPHHIKMVTELDQRSTYGEGSRGMLGFDNITTSIADRTQQMGLVITITSLIDGIGYIVLA